MNHSLPLDRLRDQLRLQLVVLGEEKHAFLDAHVPKQGAERKQIYQLLSEYVQFIENELKSSEERLPTTVFIGCEVTISYLEDATSDTFKIVYPNDADPEQNCISFLSPVGRQLLMSRRDDIVSVETPAGAMRMRMLHIQ
ncbi:GreA/GreB family elongation factor [Bacillus sp. FJAT-28004]|uniref:GreA/GreB family elongation factor n=1 Tax=Bacillus sp. FJAT-28004 TaxID=1679165 RepID=UPI0006B69CF4|nr:GreA/GreB family elongation factor [Bacillus sp. FJAT-28004]